MTERQEFIQHKKKYKSKNYIARIIILSKSKTVLTEKQIEHKIYLLCGCNTRDELLDYCRVMGVYKG